MVCGLKINRFVVNCMHSQTLLCFLEVVWERILAQIFLGDCLFWVMLCLLLF